MAINLDELKEYERKNFAVTVEKSSYDKVSAYLSITHNGMQWSSITLGTNDEISATIKALQEYLQANTACTRLETGAANADEESKPAVSSG